MAMSEWISVKDRLPDKTGRYLVLKNRIAPDCLGGNRTDIVILRFFVDKGFRMPTHIPDWINEEINEEVTHWMPLPEPPETLIKEGDYEKNKDKGMENTATFSKWKKFSKTNGEIRENGEGVIK